MRTSPAGKNQVGVVHRADHVHQAELVRLQLDGIDVDHDLAVLAAEGLRHRRAGHIGDLVAHRELRQVAQLRFVQSLALQRDQADRAGSTRRTSARPAAACPAAGGADCAMARLEIVVTAESAFVPGWK